jgi:hypothetical protein
MTKAGRSVRGLGSRGGRAVASTAPHSTRPAGFRSPHPAPTCRITVEEGAPAWTVGAGPPRTGRRGPGYCWLAGWLAGVRGERDRPRLRLRPSPQPHHERHHSPPAFIYLLGGWPCVTTEIYNTTITYVQICCTVMRKCFVIHL